MSHEPYEPVQAGKGSSSFAFVAIAIALVADGIGLALGFSDDGYGWAFEMPKIALAGIVGVTASVGGLILGILRQTQQGGRDGLVWVAIAGTLVTALGSAFLVFLALAASASV